MEVKAMKEICKRSLKYEVFKDKEVFFSNTDRTFAIVLFSGMVSDVFINFEQIKRRKSMIIFLCPGETLSTLSKTQECKIIVFDKDSIPTSENLICLLFNESLKTGKHSKSINVLRKSTQHTIHKYFSELGTLFMNSEFNEVLALSIINSIIYKCIFDTLFGDHKEIISFYNLLNSNYSEKHFVAQYADMLRLPPKELLRAFKRRGFKKPSEIIRERMLLEAKKYLAATSLSVKQIGEKLGFEDPAYFARFFKKNTGKTALEFRNKFKRNRELN